MLRPSIADGREPENIRAIAAVALKFEMHPPESQRERDQGRQNAAPHYQQVHQPPLKAAFEYEPLLDQVRGNRSGGGRCVFDELFRLKNKIEPAPEIRPRRRTLEPDRVAKDDRPERDDAGDRVAEKCRIEMFRLREPTMTRTERIADATMPRTVGFL